MSSKICTKCKVHLDISEFYTSGKKADGSPKYASWCKSCVSEKMKSYHKKTWNEEKLHYTAYKRTRNVRAYLAYLRNKAIKRKGFCISLDSLEEIWKKQEGRCALTGWDLTMVLGKGNVDTNASIDRIDSEKDYIEGNVQFVCRAINVFKSNMKEEDLIKLCKAVIDKSIKNGNC